MQYPPPPPAPSDVDPATLAALPLEIIAGEQHPQDSGPARRRTAARQPRR